HGDRPLGCPLVHRGCPICGDSVCGAVARRGIEGGQCAGRRFSTSAASNWRREFNGPFHCLLRSSVCNCDLAIRLCARHYSDCFRRRIVEKCGRRNQRSVHQEHRCQGGRKLCGEPHINQTD